MARAPFLAPDDAVLRPAPRRGLSCAESADYIGVSVTKFLEMVADGRMPKAKEIDRRRLAGSGAGKITLGRGDIGNEIVPPAEGVEVGRDNPPKKRKGNSA